MRGARRQMCALTSRPRRVFGSGGRFSASLRIRSDAAFEVQNGDQTRPPLTGGAKRLTCAPHVSPAGGPVPTRVSARRPRGGMRTRNSSSCHASRSRSSAPPAMSAARCSTSSTSAASRPTKWLRSPRAAAIGTRGLLRRQDAEVQGARALRFLRHRHLPDVGRRRGLEGMVAEDRRAGLRGHRQFVGLALRPGRAADRAGGERRRDRTASARRTSSPTRTARPRSSSWR